MTDLATRIEEFVKSKQAVGIDEIAEEIRAPKIQVEAVVSSMKRERRICQLATGKFAIRHPEPLEPIIVKPGVIVDKRPTGRPQKKGPRNLPPGVLVPPGFKWCRRCERVRPHLAFGRNSLCKPCARKEHREQRRRLCGAPTPVEKRAASLRYVKGQKDRAA